MARGKEDKKKSPSESKERAHPYADKHPAEVQRIPDYGIPERKEQPDDI